MWPDLPAPPHKQLKVKREALGLSQEELGAQLRCSQTTISHLEAGKKPPGGALAARIEFALGIPASAWRSNEVRQCA